jgi:hypothetical protein
MSDRKEQDLKNIVSNEKDFGKSLLDMQKHIGVWQAHMKEKIQKLVNEHGPLPAKAFPGRAAILIKLLDLDENSISVVYEKPGSMKIGHYLPGTRIPIKSDDELFSLASSPTIILNMAWHISTEINQFLKKKGFIGEIIDIYDPSWLKNH